MSEHDLEHLSLTGYICLLSCVKLFQIIIKKKNCQNKVGKVALWIFFYVSGDRLQTRAQEVWAKGRTDDLLPHDSDFLGQ